MVAVSPRGGARIGDSLTYLCPVGEVPLGETSQTCTKSGTWSGLPIACKPVDCGKVPGLADGDIHILDGRTSWGARVRASISNCVHIQTTMFQFQHTRITHSVMYFLDLTPILT